MQLVEIARRVAGTTVAVLDMHDAFSTLAVAWLLHRYAGLASGLRYRRLRWPANRREQQRRGQPRNHGHRGGGAVVYKLDQRNRTAVFRVLGLDAFIGYNFSTNKVVGGLGNVMSIGYRPAFATSGHEAQFGSRFRFGGGHGFQRGFFAYYTHALLWYAERDFPACADQGSESQYWLGFAGGAELLWTKRGNKRGTAMSANLLVGTAYGRDRVSLAGVMRSGCSEAK